VRSATTRYLSQALSVTVLVTAAAAWPAHAWAGRAGLQALGLAAAICLLGALFGRIAAIAIAGLDPGPEAGPHGVQVGILVRLMTTLAMTLPVVLMEPVPPVPFAAWLGLHYLAQLALEVFVSLRELGQNHGPTRTPARASQPEAEPSREGDAPSTGSRPDDDATPSSKTPPTTGARQG